MTSRKSLDGRRLRWIFHESSKNFELGEVRKAGGTLENWSEIDYKQYDAGTTIPLSSDVDLDEPLRAAISERRSPKLGAVEQRPVSIEDLSACIGEAAGITQYGETDDDHYRAYPSGGARYPLEVYVTVLAGDDLAEGVYHYDVKENCLAQLRTDSAVTDLDFFYRDIRENVSVVVFVTARMERTTRKYGERGYRYANVEAGHLMQNVCLLAEARGLACRPYGGFIEDRADSYLRLQNEPETTLYTGLLGGRSV
ncbi:SagB/ThcOx family dehydrogenase [Haloplanus halophilus]|uniref:SagB/ThcOx family dehydrogenase n=1 Tax=Haloplanus halophilus TaxID=2949993 RepID=UPI00203D6544|nr:SagB/ThcOx family dehydrogenase [Haloplanus sp. GDY1]